MKSNLNEALSRQATFTFENTSSAAARRLCLFPGHFNTQALALSKETGVTKGSSTVDVLKNAIVYNGNKANIVAAGYACDQVAYEYFSDQPSDDTIKVVAESPITKYNDFLEYIKLVGLQVTKMRITNLNANANIFNQQMQVSASTIGGIAGSEFITLSEYIKADNYHINFIDIDLEERELELDSTTLLFMTLPESAKFSIKFIVEPID